MNIYQMIAYEGVRTFVSPWLAFALRINSEGAGNIPEEEGALLICNHRSLLEPLALMSEVERYIHFVGGTRGSILPMVKTLYRMTGMVNLSLKGGNKTYKGMDEAVQLMKKGEIVGIFPEGIESFMRSGRSRGIKYFRTGFARMAIEAGVPIIPAAVLPEAEVSLPFGEKLPARIESLQEPDGPLDFLRYRDLLVRIGKPIYLKQFLNEPLTKTAIDTLSGKLRRIVIKLYNGEDLDRFLYGERPFDVYTDRV